MIDLKHMDIGSRNQRLRETLEGMGLFVVPVYSQSDPTQIDWLQVSAGLPGEIAEKTTDVSAGAAIASPIPSPNISDNIETADSSRNRVIDFPTVI